MARFNKKLKILFVAASPEELDRLRLDKELREIEEKLKLAKYRNSFKIEKIFAVRPGDLTQAFHDHNPDIVHFSGHGGQSGELIFEDENGNAKPIEMEAIGDLFELYENTIQCVILNFCYSNPLAKVVSFHIKHVIGMQDSITDQSAINFAIGFYKALGAGYPIDVSFKFGRVEIGFDKKSEKDVPIIYDKLEKMDYNIPLEEMDQFKNMGIQEFVKIIDRKNANKPVLLTQFLLQNTNLSQIISDKKGIEFVVTKSINDLFIIAFSFFGLKEGMILFFDKNSGKIIGRQDAQQVRTLKIIRIPNAYPKLILRLEHWMVSATSWTFGIHTFFTIIDGNVYNIFECPFEEIVAGWNAFDEDIVKLYYKEQFKRLEGKLHIIREGHADLEKKDNYTRSKKLPMEKYIWDDQKKYFIQTFGRITKRGKFLAETYGDFATPKGDWFKIPDSIE